MSSSRKPSSKISSSVRRTRLADKIESLGVVMVQKCSRCVAKDIACRVHISSGKCGACVRSNHKGCDIVVSEGDWSRLRKQRAILEEKMSLHLRRMRELRATLQRLQEEEAAAWEKKSRLQKEMDLLESREAEALSVEKSLLEEQESAEPGRAPASPVPILPWSSLEEVPDTFWSDLCFDPEAVSSSNQEAAV